jgi:YD repeat-containing protein
VRFGGTKDLSSLLNHGSEAVARIGGGALAGLVKASGTQEWYMWDASANAGQDRWSQLSWRAAVTDGAWTTITGTRTTQPVDAYLVDTRFEQTWSVAADLSSYQVTTSREVTRGGNQRPRHSFEQRVAVDRGRLTLAADVGASLPDMPVPAQYVPGAIVPLVVRELAERPTLVRTESFAGVETVAPPGLLTLFVTKLSDAPMRLDDDGEPMECVTVSVNGTGVVSRWYYSAEHELRFIDFAGGLKAAGGAGR